MTTIERTQRWRTAFVFVLVTSAAGVYLERPALLLSSAVALAYAAYPLVTPTPTVDLALSRTVTEETPAHGESVTVTVTATNTGTRTLPDLRLVDGVPTYLTVTDGTPRHTAALRPGASTTFEYAVDAKSGTHRFEPATAVVYDVSGGTRIRTEVEAGRDPEAEMERERETETETRGERETESGTGATDRLDCAVAVETLPTRRQTRRQTGRTAVDASGTGIEFYQTRAHQPGDPSNRIDWRRFARTGELTTVEFRAERLRTVVLCVDARASARRRKRPGEPDAVAYSIAAATELLRALLVAGERVGVAVVGDEFEWLAPDRGGHHRAEASQLLRTHREGSSGREERPGSTPKSASQSQSQSESGSQSETHSERIQQLLVRSQGAADVLLLSPLLDDFGVTATERLEAHGHPVTVLSPDVTTTETLGGELARVERRNRVRSLRERRVPVCDWTPGDPVDWQRATKNRPGTTGQRSEVGEDLLGVAEGRQEAAEGQSSDERGWS